MTKPNLKKSLFKLWDTDKSYFDLARKANLELSEHKRKMLNFIPQNSKVLDVACGSAENGFWISNFSNYFGIDISKIGLKMAKDYSESNFFLIRGDVSEIPFKNNSFDVIISTYSLEHFLEPQKAMKEMHRVCMRYGKIILISPSYDLPFRSTPAVKIKRILPRINHTIKRLFDQLMIFLIKDRFSFKIVQNPAFLEEGYKQDNDAIYPVYSLEVMKYLQKLGCRVLFLKIPKEDLKHGLKRLVRFLVNLLPLYRYSCVDLFIVAKKL